MKKPTNKRKTTTVSCDEQTRQFIADEAERTGLLQREVLAKMVELYKRSATLKDSDVHKKSADFDYSEIEKVIEKRITKDVNRVIGFIQKQEEIYLKQILENAKKNGVLIQQQINILKEF